MTAGNRRAGTCHDAFMGYLQLQTPPPQPPTSCCKARAGEILVAGWMRTKPLGLVAASGRALHFLVSLGEPCLCLLSVCVSICVGLFMLPQHIFASPVVMFTKRKFKYMSCGGKAINLHAETRWSLGVRVRGGGAGGEGLGQMDTGASTGVWGRIHGAGRGNKAGHEACSWALPCLLLAPCRGAWRRGQHGRPPPLLPTPSALG